MALQNRITPFGDIIAAPARGTFMGNRGIIHDPATRRLLTRRWQHRAWICCLLAFKGYRHPIMGRGAYTELFFLDEATALAAGHRPCAYCRRADFDAFKRAWAAGTGVPEARFVRAPEIDRTLHRERVTRGRQKVCFEASIATLPDGVFVARGEEALLVWEDKLFAWRPAGYRPPLARPRCETVTVLTPRSTVAALVAGYRAAIHESAAG